jgi:hypothetical protein
VEQCEVIDVHASARLQESEKVENCCLGM